MKALLVVLLSCLLLTGCASVMGKVETKITDPEGKVWVIESKNNALVSITRPDGTKVVIDNKGRISPVEAAMIMALSNTNINLGLSNKPQEVD